MKEISTNSLTMESRRGSKDSWSGLPSSQCSNKSHGSRKESSWTNRKCSAESINRKCSTHSIPRADSVISIASSTLSIPIFR